MIQADTRPPSGVRLAVSQANMLACTQLPRCEYSFVPLHGAHPGPASSFLKLHVWNKSLQLRRHCDLFLMLDSDAWVGDVPLLHSLTNYLAARPGLHGAFSRDPLCKRNTFINAAVFLLRQSPHNLHLLTTIVPMLIARNRAMVRRWPYEQGFMSDAVHQHRNAYLIMKPDVLSTPRGMVVRHHWSWKEPSALRGRTYRLVPPVLPFAEPTLPDHTLCVERYLDSRPYPNLQDTSPYCAWPPTYVPLECKLRFQPSDDAWGHGPDGAFPTTEFQCAYPDRRQSVTSPPPPSPPPPPPPPARRVRTPARCPPLMNQKQWQARYHKRVVHNITAQIASGNRPPRPSYLLDGAVRAEHASPEGRWHADRHRFVRSVKAEVAKRHARPTVVLTICDASFSFSFAHWLRGVETVSGLVPAVVAFDEPAYDFFDGRGVPTLLYKPPLKDVPVQSRSCVEGACWHDPRLQDDLVMYAKIDATRLLVSAGLTVVFSESDIFIMRNLSRMVDPHPGYDAHFSSHRGDTNETNVGFFVVNPTAGSLSVLENLARWVASPAFEPCHDQKLFSFAWRGGIEMTLDARNRNESAGLLHCYCDLTTVATTKALMPPDGLRLRRIPVDDVAVPFAGLTTRLIPPPSVVNRTASAVHVWSSVVQPSLKTTRDSVARSWGLYENWDR